MDIDLALKISSPLITVILGAVVKFYTESSNVISYVGHVSVFSLQDENKTKVFTHSIIVRNAGRKTANNIRLGHNILPENINIYPEIQYKIEATPSGSSEIVLNSLVPKEQVTISYLYFPPITWDKINTYTKSDDGLAKIIKVIPMPQPAKWSLILAWFLIFIGASVSLYWLLQFVAKLI